ncbi:MAG: M15 family metallopeptidase [Rudanella sp.]|nr:M15 family metallopeptidase [Rudanella sp.]
MAANLDLLVPEFKPLAIQLLDNCQNRGIEMRPNETLRSPFSQAILWRQSRAIKEITEKINEFEAKGASFLAHCLQSVGPQHGDHVTNAPPGLSWHKYGEAIDCIWIVDGKSLDEKTLVNGINGFNIYANEVQKLHLEAGLFWASFADPLMCNSGQHRVLKEYSLCLKFHQ